MKHLNHLIVVALAFAALLLTAGCSFDLWTYAVGFDPDKDDDDYYALRCDSQLKVFWVAVVRYDAPGASESAGSLLGMVGKPCTPSPPKGRPGSMSEPANSPAAAPDPNDNIAAPNRRDIATTTPPPTPPALINTFPWLVPLPFAPAFPLSDAGKNPLKCVPTMEAFLVNHTQNSVSVIGLCPFRQIKDIAVRSNPLSVAVTPDGATAVVTSYDGAVTFIDTATNTVSGTLDLLDYNPHGIAISPDSTRAYVTHYLDQHPSLLVIDIPNRKLLSAIALPKAYPRVVTLTPDGTQAWVNYLSDRVISIVDVLTGTVASTVDLSTEVDTGMVFNPTGTKAYIAVYPDQLFVVDTATLATVARITVGTSPIDLVMTPDGNRLFVSVEADPLIYWIDTATNKVTQRSRPPGGSVVGGSMGLMVFH